MNPYFQLMRLDKPVGYWLLLFPGWWAIALATPHGQLPDWRLMALFFIGAVVMRGAGCIVNDLADRELDKKVARTATRPLASGAVKPWQAIALALFLTLIGLIIALVLKPLALLVAAASLPFIIAYPFMKRITWWPQVFLGFTFNWGVLLGTAAVTGTLTLSALVLYLASVFWTLGYDTIYAFQDIADDEKAGIKSSARRLGAAAPKWVGFFYGLFWVGAVAAGAFAYLGLGFYIGMALVLRAIVEELQFWRMQDAHSSLVMFKANAVIGGMLLAAIIAGKFF